jgi:hypothetical protein
VRIAQERYNALQQRATATATALQLADTPHRSATSSR